MSSQAHTGLGRVMEDLISECITASGGFRKAGLGFPLGQKGAAWAVEMEPLLVASTWFHAYDWSWGSLWLKGVQLVLTQWPHHPALS